MAFQQLSQLLLDDSLEAELAHVAREVLIQIIEDLAHEYVRYGTAALKIKGCLYHFSEAEVLTWQPLR